MKKIAKIMSAALLSAAMLASVSCSKKSESKSAAAEASAKGDVTNEEEFTKFNSDDFRGDWIVGDWDFVAEYESDESDESESSTAKIKITPDGNATVEADGQVKNMSASDVRKQLLSVLSDVKMMEKEGITLEGKPYFVINKAKTIIALNFSTLMDRTTVHLKIIIQKVGA